MIACGTFSTFANADIVYFSPVQSNIANGGNGHTYQAVRVSEGISWTAAQSLAETAGGTLATIQNETENTLIWNIMKSDATLWSSGGYQGCWLGGYQLPGSSEPLGGWTWVTGETWSYSAWGAGEPNNAAGYEHVLNLMDFSGGYGNSGNVGWNDMQENGGNWGPMHSLIIEFPTPAPSALGLVALAGAFGRRRRV